LPGIDWREKKLLKGAEAYLQSEKISRSEPAEGIGDRCADSVIGSGRARKNWKLNGPDRPVHGGTKLLY